MSGILVVARHENGGSPISTLQPHGLSVSLGATPVPGVLVVDDDSMLRKLMTTVLQRQGFTVWTAANGSEAIEAYQEHRQEIGVVLMDVRMPGQDGPETLVQLRRINPALCCCFMSGHTGEYTPDELLACGASHCFDKPFRVDDVAETLLRLAKAS